MTLKCPARIVFVLLLFVLLISAGTAQARRKRFAPPPRVILVQLKCEKRKIAFFKTSTDPSLAVLAAEDAAKVRQCTINDFADHFSKCKVYYFMDTNTHLVIDKKFDGVLLNADGTVAKNVALSANDSDYNIVYYGSNVALQYKGLVVMSDSYEMIFHRTRLAYYMLSKHYKETYSYKSKKFESIEYYPCAKFITWHVTHPRASRMGMDDMDLGNDPDAPKRGKKKDG